MTRHLETADIEVLSNLFTITLFRHDTQEWFQYVIHKSRNDYEKLIKHLKSEIYMVGYNIEKYDYPIIHHIIKHYDQYKDLSGENLAQNIYRKSQEIIEMEFSAIADRHKFFPILDLYLIWHYDNKALATSLKHLEISMRLPNVEDMPYEHDHWITTNEEIEQILGYNKNDVEATYQFYLITIGETDLSLYKGKNKLQLRKDIKSKFGLPCFNYNDVKIGDELNKLNYLNNNPGVYLTRGGTKRDVIYFHECILPNIKFESEQLNKFLTKLKTITVSDEQMKFEESIIYKGVNFSFGLGGIHSVDSPRIIQPTENQKLEDRDCTSMHPTIILKYGFYPEHLGKSWLLGYQWTFDQRVLNKKLSKDKSLSQDERKRCESIQEAYKLSLNGGGFGKTGELSSWQHDSKVMLSVTINNQLFLLMLAEKYLNNGLEVISANTDGIVLLFDKSMQSLVDQIDREWEEESRHTLEYTEYTKFIQTSVNDYITLKPDGECKFKGDFCIDRELHKNPSMTIVPIALKKYFIDGVPIRDTIQNHDNIYDFCLSFRVRGKDTAHYKYVEGYKEKVDRLHKNTRYYISNDGGSIFKRSTTDKKELKITGVNVGYVATIFNKYIKKDMKDYNINYNFYVNECRKIIDKIETPILQQTLF